MKGDGSVFVYSVRGTIEGAEGLGGDDLYVNYCFNYGQDWELVAVSSLEWESIIYLPCIIF